MMRTLIILGAVPAALLALFFDIVLRILERPKRSSKRVILTICFVCIMIASPLLWSTEKERYCYCGQTWIENLKF